MKTIEDDSEKLEVAGGSPAAGSPLAGSPPPVPPRVGESIVTGAAGTAGELEAAEVAETARESAPVPPADDPLGTLSSPPQGGDGGGLLPRTLKWIGWILAVPVLLFVVVGALLYVPFVQDFAVRQLVAYAEEETGYDIQLERLRISFPLDLDLQGLLVRDAEGDTLLATKSLIVDLDMARVLRWRVGVDAVDLREARVNSKDVIDAMTLRGELGQLYVKAHEVDLKRQHVTVNDLSIKSARVDIALSDTTIVDEEESEPAEWVIDVERARADNVDIRFATALDSMVLTTSLQALTLDDGHIDLGRSIYKIGSASLAADTLHFALSNADSSRLAVPVPKFNIDVQDVSFSETPLIVEVGALSLNTAVSRIEGRLRADMVGLMANARDALLLELQSELSTRDIIDIAGNMLPLEASELLQQRPKLEASVQLLGNLKQLELRQLEVAMPGSFELAAAGELHNFRDSQRRNANLNYRLETQDMSWLQLGVAVPPLMLEGTAGISGNTYDLLADMQQGDGTAHVQARYDDAPLPRYSGMLDVQSLNLGAFLTDMPLGLCTIRADVDGEGLDLLNRAARLQARAEIGRLQYDHYDLNNVTLEAKAANGHGTAHVVSDNELLTADIDLAAKLARPTADLTFSIDLGSIDLYALGFVEEPLSTSMCMHLDGGTDLNTHHRLTGSVSDIVLYAADSIYYPEDVSLDVLLDRDTTHVDLASGDLMLRLDGAASYDALLTQLGHFMAEADQQLEERHVDMLRLRQRLPQLDLYLSSGCHNPAHDILAREGLDLGDVELRAHMNPWDGLNGDGHIHTLKTGSMQLDTITLDLRQDTMGISLDSHVHNGRSNPQISFDASMTAFLRDKGAGAHLTYLDDQGKKGVDIGLLIRMEEGGFRMKLYPFDQVIAYRTFHINDSNYVFLATGNRVDADVDLLADDGTGLKLYSTPGSDALQDLSVAINHLNLGELTSVLPYFPHITGFLNGDAHLIQTDETLSVSTDMTGNELTYESAPIGELGLQAVYLPNADGSHFVDGFLLHEGDEVASFNGTYTPGTTTDGIALDIDLTHLPLSLANGFIPDGMVTLDGTLLGGLHVDGTTDKPVVDGQVVLEQMRMLSDMYSLNLTFADDTVAVVGSNMHFDQVKAYSTGKEPLVLDGNVNFASLDNIGLDLTLKATDYELINAKKTARSVAYGKMLVDCNAMLRGTLNDMQLFGRLNVKSGTDLTYVLDNSPLTVEDQLTDLVEFVDFSDTLRVVTVETEKPQNLNMFFNIVIDESAQAHCLLSADGSSYVNLEGGGTLNMTYSPEKDLQMTGRYTINKGTLKYTMMVIPLKEFTIKSGSYVEFRGPIGNPYLSLSATERMRTTITENDQPRSVNFDVGMDISQTLERMGLEFTLAAPEDMSIQNELAQMSTEQRGRVAVTMLATGMYITDSGSASSGGFSTQNALNSFLQSQISNIAGKALKSVDISMGVEQGTSSTGGTTTDYSFSFAKRFWGNRISVIVGGKVSTGEDAENTGQTLIDNVSVEYRLDKGATRYVNLFYDKNYESVLDGEVIEYGAGLVLRRKSDRLGELFIFRKKEE